MIHRQIKMCEWSEHVLYRRIDHITSFEYNSSRIIIIFAIVLSLIHHFCILSIISNHISRQIVIFISTRSNRKNSRVVESWKACFFIKDFNIFHLYILRILRLFFVFCSLKTITRSCNLWFLYLKKKIDWCKRISFKFI
jgi:hypothetical protein